MRATLAGLDQPVLLIWDNAEDVWANREVRGFIRERPANVQALLTTRENPEMTAWTVVETTRLDDAVMTGLFLLLGTRANVKLTGAQDMSLIEKIVGWLQGHPLALELVVPLAAKRGLKRVWTHLQRKPLKGIDAAFAVSFDNLSADQQRLFTRLSVFIITFEWDAAEALLPDVDDVEELLDVLVQRALIGFDGARFAYHALVRQFAYERLQAREDVLPIHQLAAEYLRDKLTDQDRGGTPEEALEEVDQWARAHELRTFATRASALVGSLDRLGYWDEIDQRLQRALMALDQGADAEKLSAKLLSDRAIIADKSARWSQAIEFYQQSLATKEQVGDIHGMALSQMGLGNVYQSKGEWDWAIEYYEQSLATLEQVGDIHGMAQTMGNLGNFYQAQGDTDQAARYMAQAYLIFAQLGAAETQQAGQLLVSILGSAEAANEYLQQFAAEQGQPAAAAPQPQQAQGITLDQLFDQIIQARAGDTQLGEQLYTFLQGLAADSSQPDAVRALARVLTRILIGERTPDLSQLPAELKEPVQELLARLAAA